MGVCAAIHCATSNRISMTMMMMLISKPHYLCLYLPVHVNAVSDAVHVVSHV